MAMVVSRKSKLCVCSLVLLVVLGISLAVLSTMGFFETSEHHVAGTAEKYSYQKTPQVVNVSSNRFTAYKNNVTFM